MLPSPGALCGNQNKEIAMKRILLPFLVCMLLLSTEPASANDAVLPLHVLYVGPADGPRPAAFAELLKKHFARVTIARRMGFEPAQARDADVVMLDWSQAETQTQDAQSPFGKLEDWSKPTVLLNSAGLLLAGPWRIIGGAG
jgi:hypothetical protein